MAVDSGKADTKVCTKLNDNAVAKRTFPTRVEEKDDDKCLATMTGVSDTGIIVEYDGKIYGVGDIVSSDDSFTSNQNSKNDILHKISTLTAIAGSVNNDEQVNVAIGCPIEVFMSKVNREKYLNNMLPAGRIDITINGISKHFTITKKLVLPESLGVVFARPRLFEDKYAGIIDIGGLNVNSAAVNEVQIVAEACFTEKLGRRTIEKAVKDYAEVKYETTFSMSEVNTFVNKGYIHDNADEEAEEESRQFIAGVLNDHLNRISKACESHGWNLRNMNLIFIGGTSIILRDLIKEAYPKAVIVDNANYVNAQGFLTKFCEMR